MTGKVLVCLHDELMNGASISILRAIPLLEEHGWQFSFWVPSPGPARDHLDALGADVHGLERPIASSVVALRLPPGLRSRARAVPGYLTAFREWVMAKNPDLVHANSLYSFAEALAARRLGFRTLLHVHDMAPPGRKRAAARWICRRGVDRTIAVSEACAASYAHAGWKPGVIREAAPVPAEPAEIRPGPEPFVVGTVGVVSHRKGSDLFVEAAEIIDDPAFEFRMVGAPSDPFDADWGAALVRRAERAGIRHLPSADIESELRTWDLFVLPSRRDPCPISMLEAMALGLPVIGTRVDGLAEEIDAKSGVLVPGDDAPALAQAIRRVKSLSSRERGDLGAAARERVSSEFSLSRQADELHRAYADVLGRPK
ncbi:MAG: glycosyltransferase family 4 protein [Actinomycetota bacterium]|nr:glycosyltransferase family 4 protein [Actinomycetota bacterium]